MFPFLGSRRRQRPSSGLTRHRRIRFESLEKRYCLAAPVITSFQIDSVDGTDVSLSGFVTDEIPETVEIEFSGVVCGSTTADSYGYFSYVTDAVSLGMIHAYAHDGEDLWSQAADVELDSDMPTIESLAVTYGNHNEVTITGTVVDEDPGNLTVYLNGAVNGMAFTEANGDFSFHTDAGSLGTVTVVVYDVWFQEGGNSVEIEGDDPPDILNFNAELNSFGVLTVEGDVTDEDPVGLTVIITFLGVEYQTITDSYGHFFWQMQLEEGTSGVLSVFAYDWWPLMSGVYQDYIIYPGHGYSE